jgi:transposase InsO family protein
VSHPNSRYTALGRWQFVRMVVQDGSTFADAAACSNVARSTVWEWVRRWRAASESERASLACLMDRSSRPRRSPTRVPEDEEQRICELRQRTGWGPRLLAEQAGRPHSTVHRVPQRAGCSIRPVAEREAIVRYEWPCPGQLLHMDVKKFARFTEPEHKTTGDRARRSRHPGWEYVHSIVDDYSRLAYSEICEDERAETVRAFTERALDFYLSHGIVAERLMTDNHMSYRCSHSFARLLTSRQIQHIRTRPYTPRTNGKVERFQQTLAREWAHAMQYASNTARREALPHWLNHYNEQQHHSAISNQPPLTPARNLLGHHN